MDEDLFDMSDLGLPGRMLGSQPGEDGWDDASDSDGLSGDSDERRRRKRKPAATKRKAARKQQQQQPTDAGAPAGADEFAGAAADAGSREQADDEDSDEIQIIELDLDLPQLAAKRAKLAAEEQQRPGSGAAARGRRRGKARGGRGPRRGRRARAEGGEGGQEEEEAGTTGSERPSPAAAADRGCRAVLEESRRLRAQLEEALRRQQDPETGAHVHTGATRDTCMRMGGAALRRAPRELWPGSLAGVTPSRAGDVTGAPGSHTAERGRDGRLRLSAAAGVVAALVPACR
ncbi:hypothetical protein MNEG_12458 [Monoraphidium neglectum]|uniref:Uncharacterized protein n=1 Tax=Monoraphidium neglectum TaxID=145388 RepID=A0A0D2KI84_9CHLO|nr:hypothetical protein MNEG_12458 [Monoraphidium neglectum]KIY95503.1 hypothetical protein MNEG_12458 [Monoraphidium neglectum]|eukprot:XP_013894523.1 hypothetical protein MNEG_12458 [Monoraphidium neglectum]